MPLANRAITAIFVGIALASSAAKAASPSGNSQSTGKNPIMVKPSRDTLRRWLSEVLYQTASGTLSKSGNCAPFQDVVDLMKGGAPNLAMVSANSSPQGLYFQYDKKNTDSLIAVSGDRKSDGRWCLILTSLSRSAGNLNPPGGFIVDADFKAMLPEFALGMNILSHDLRGASTGTSDQKIAMKDFTTKGDYLELMLESGKKIRIPSVK